MKKFIALGTECVDFRAAADKAKGKQPDVLILKLLYHCQVLVWHFYEHKASLRNALFRAEELKTKLMAKT
jgi:hypothetical protein